MIVIFKAPMILFSFGSVRIFSGVFFYIIFDVYQKLMARTKTEMSPENQEPIFKI